MGVLIWGAMSAVAAPAQPLTAERAMANYRGAFVPLAELDCPKSEDTDEIVVCGRPIGTPDPNRLPLEPLPGDRISGEAMSAVETANLKDECSPVGRQSSCGGFIPIFPIIGVAVKAVKALVDGE